MTSPLSPEAVAQMVADVLIARLKYWGEGFLIKDTELGRYVRSAADMLTTLAAENATLRAERDAAVAVADDLRLWVEIFDKAGRVLQRERDALRASEAAALEREGDMRQALQAAMDDNPGWYDLARESRNSSLSARTKRLQAQALTPTADKEPKP